MRSDAALAERVTAGDEAAFDVLYERHRAVVLAVAMGVLGTMHDAEDATQETFSALAISLRTKPPAELRPWLIRVARNAAIDTTRRRRHRLLTLDGEIPEAPARPTGGGKAELAVVFDGIRELPEGQRMALLMRELGGHTYAEIADFLATDEEAVKGLIARARVGLRAFREASELPCASARTTIAAEPDGRRYDRTVRRHLRACASCRSYRDALRDDAKALRAGLPLQAGGVAAGTGIGAGPLAAAKGAMVGYSLTQAAATCAASACAVGAVGSMVLMGPLHRFGLPTILPAAKHVKVQRPDAKLVTASLHVKVSTHAPITLHASGGAVTPSGARTSDATAQHAGAGSRALPALKSHDNHQPVAVEHWTLQVTAAPTTSTTPLSSIPITTPAGSQPAAQSTQSPPPAATATSAGAPTGTSSQSQSTSATPATTASASTSASPSQGSDSNPGASSTGPSSTEPASTNPSSAVSDAIASRAVQEATERPTIATSSTGSSSPAGGYQSNWSEFGWSNPEYGGGYVGSGGNPSPGTTDTTTVTTGTPVQNTAPTGTGTPDQNTAPTDTGTGTGTGAPDQNTAPTGTGTPDQNPAPTATGTPDQDTSTTDTGTPDQDTSTTDTGTQTSTAITTTSTDSSTSPSLDGTSAGTATDTGDASADI